MGGVKGKGAGLAGKGGDLAFTEVGSPVTSLLPAPSGAGTSHCLSVCAVLGAAAQNIKISLRFISSPSRSFEIPQFEGESYFNPLVPINLITVSIDNGQDSK